jgi:hypothetical protein
MPDNDASDLADDIDGNSVTQVSISDKIKAAQYQAAQEAAASAPGHFGLRFTQLVPPGCG